MEREQYELAVDPTLEPCPTLPALVWAEGIACPTRAPGLPESLQETLAEVKAAGEAFIPSELRSRVRDMLRFGRYKPTGRGKPASEYLLRAAVSDSFPRVNPPVDVNNWVSLESGYPASIFDAGLSGPHLLLRRGKEGERYVFNPSGHTLELRDLLVLCRYTEAGWWPCGSPIKDSMDTKIGPGTRNVIAVLYAPADEPHRTVGLWAARFAQRLAKHCNAHTTDWQVRLSPSSSPPYPDTP